MDSFKNGSLEIIAGKSGDRSSLKWIGISDDRNPSVSLDPYFDGIIDELEGTALTVDFMELAYMNSSTVHPIIKFHKKLDARKINAVIQYDASSKWQKAVFKAFKTLTHVLPHLTIEGK